MENMTTTNDFKPDQGATDMSDRREIKPGSQIIEADGTVWAEIMNPADNLEPTTKRRSSAKIGKSSDPIANLCTTRLTSLNLPITFKAKMFKKIPQVVMDALKKARNKKQREEVLEFFELVMRSAAEDGDEGRATKILNTFVGNSPGLYFSFCRKPILDPSQAGEFTRNLVGILSGTVRHRDYLVQELAMFVARRLSGDLSATSPILVGPPGTGKSYIISMLAQAVSAAGIRTETVMQQMTQSGRNDHNEEVPMRLLGTSKKYGNGEPGAIFSALSRGETEATVVFLDEAEKGGMRDFMVSLLDPKTSLEDSYVKEIVGNMDMRHRTLFILAANDGDRFSCGDEDPLGSRVERIDIQPYDPDELRQVLMELAMKDMAIYGVHNEEVVASVVKGVLGKSGSAVSLRQLENATKKELFMISTGIIPTHIAEAAVPTNSHRRIGFRVSR